MKNGTEETVNRPPWAPRLVLPWEPGSVVQKAASWGPKMKEWKVRINIGIELKEK